MLDLYGIFKDGMVLQRGKTIKVFGMCASDSSIDASISDGFNVLSSGNSRSNTDGRFLVEMDKLDAGGPYTLTVISGSDRLLLKDIYIGDVWLSCGEDNMLMPLKMTEKPSTSFGLIGDNRRFHYYEVPVSDQYDDRMYKGELGASWITVDPQNAGEVSGVSYYFVLELMKKVDCHIGVIGCFAMNSSVSSWQSIDSLQSSPEGKHFIEVWQQEISSISDSEFLRMRDDYDKDYKTWQRFYDREFSKMPDEGYDILRRSSGDWPREYPNGRLSYKRPGGLFDTVMMRVFPMNIKGVIYYQGESDAEEHAEVYGAVLQTLIHEWRTLLRDQELPFLICQLPMYIDRDRKFMGYDDYKWPLLREQQYKTSRHMKNTYLAILSDCGEFDNIHPIDKRTPGTRLAYLALKNVYDFDDVSATAPHMIDIRGMNGGAELSFQGDFNMLILNNFGDSGFEVSGKDGKFYPCDASVDFDGKTVTVSCPYVLEPVTIRYAYFSFGQSSLLSDTGLAVLPFTRNIVKNLNDDY